MILAKPASLLKHRLAIPVLLFALLAITFALYFPGLFGNFIFDDYINIVTNEEVHMTTLSWSSIVEAWNSGLASTLSRPLSMLSFGLNHYFFGLDPSAFKLTNLIIHLVNAAGIYLLSRELLNIAARPDAPATRRLQLLSLFIAACWALHPLNVSSVLYVVQRMTLLSSLTVIYSLIVYCRFRQDTAASARRAVATMAAICVLLVFGILFKESAALVVLFILSIEVFLLRFQSASSAQTLFLRLYVIVLLVVPAVLVVIALVIAPEQIIGNYGVRDFTLWERLMTECRVIWDYIYWLLLPDTRLFTLYHDSYPISRGLLEPVSTLISLLALAGLIAFTWICRFKLPVLCFGIAFFLAGHAMESTAVALELVFEHRNYLPGFGLLFGLIYTLLVHGQFVMRMPATRVVLAAYLLFLAHGTFTEARKWSNANDQLLSNLRQYPDSHRINYGLGYLYLNVAPLTPDRELTIEVAGRYFERAAELHERAIRGHVGYILANSQIGKPLDPGMVEALVYRLENYELEVSEFTEISMLTECWYSGFCKFEKSLLTSFYNAVANNVATPPIMIQGILDQVGTAIITAFGNREDGMSLLYLARSKREDLTIIDLKLIELELASGNYEQARAVLQAAFEKPRNPAFEQALRQMSIRLDEVRP